MRNRRVPQFEKPANAQRPALAGQILATTSMSLLKDKSLAAPDYTLTGPGRAERAIAHLPTVFDNLYCKLERRCDEQSPQPVRRRALAINWVEPGELPIEINIKIGSIS